MALTIAQFARRPRKSSFSVERLYSEMRSYLPEDIRIQVWTNRYRSNGLWNRFVDMILASTRQADVYHVTGDVHYLTYFLEPRRTILTVLDCIPLDRHRGVKFLLFWFFWYWLPEKRCARIVVISEATGNRLLKYLHCDPGKVQVIHCHVSPEFCFHAKAFDVARPRILHVGTAANKNLERHIAALAGMSCELVVIGELSETHRDLLALHAIHFENYVGLSSGALVDQYVRCDMLLFASTYEGFGLPIVEAQAVGRPVVTSNLLSMPEVSGEGACLVNPFDVNDIHAGVCRVTQDPDYRDKLVERGLVNVKRFRIENIAAEYAKLYREIGMANIPRRRAKT